MKTLPQSLKRQSKRFKGGAGFLKSLFLELDLFPTPVQFLIAKKRSHQTIIGAFITIMCLCCILAYLLNQRLEFSTLYSTIFYEEPPYYSLNKDNFTLQFAFQNQFQKNYINPSIYYPTVTLININTTTMDDGTKKIKTSKQNIPINECSKNGIIQEELEDQLDDQDLNNTYCLDWNSISNLAVYGTDDSEHYQYLNISFSYCNNDTSNVCSDAITISNTLNRNYIHLQLTSYITDLRNFDQPMIPKIQDIYTTISSQVLKDVSIYMQPITTITDSGYFSSIITKETTIAYQTDKEIIDFNSESSLANIIIKLSNTEQVSYRIYPKVQDILASAGGLWQIIVVIASVIQRPFSQLSYNMELINALFNFEQDKKKKQKYLSTTPTSPDDQNVFNSQQKQEEIQQKQNAFAQRRMKSIRFPNGRIQVQPTFKQILLENEKVKQVRKVFNLFSSQLQLKFKESLQYLTYRPENEKMDQLDYSIQKLDSTLDIFFIVEKLQEIDKLKMILLTKSQLNLFEFLPKPFIYLDPSSPKQEQLQSHSSILKPQKTNQEKAEQASIAFEELLQDFQNPITKSLIQGLDEELINVLIQEYELRKKSNQSSIDVSPLITQIRNQNQKLYDEPDEIKHKETPQEKHSDENRERRNSAIKSDSECNKSSFLN